MRKIILLIGTVVAVGITYLSTRSSAVPASASVIEKQKAKPTTTTTATPKQTQEPSVETSSAPSVVPTWIDNADREPGVVQ